MRCCNAAEFLDDRLDGNVLCSQGFAIGRKYSNFSARRGPGSCSGNDRPRRRRDMDAATRVRSIPLGAGRAIRRVIEAKAGEPVWATRVDQLFCAAREADVMRPKASAG